MEAPYDEVSNLFIEWLIFMASSLQASMHMQFISIEA